MSEFYLDREFHYRPDTSDQIVIEEVYVKNCYRFPNSTGTVVDIGANIGSFTCLAAKTAKKVLSFEPEPHNFELLKQNTKKLKNVKIFDVAVGIPGVGEIQDLQGGSHLSFTDNHLENSQVIDVVNPNLIWKGEVDFMKVDCEGSEYDIFDTLTDEKLSSIKELCIEFHPWSQERHNATLARLMNFFDFEVIPHGLWYGIRI